MTRRADGARSAFSYTTIGIALAVVAGTLWVFAPVRTFEFLPLDDPYYVYANPHVAGGLTLQNAAWAFTPAGFRHPLTWLSLMVDVQWFGLSPAALHTTNVVIHAGSVALLFLFLVRTTRETWLSAFVAAVFAVHPLRVESVAWIAERKDVLSMLFCLLTLHAYVSFARRPGVLRYLGVTLLLTAGLLAKPMLVTLPVVLGLIDVWPLARTGRAGSGVVAVGMPRRTARQLVAEKLPWLVLALAATVLNVVWRVQPIATLEEVPLALRLGNTVVSYVQYSRLLFWPAGLTPFRPLPGALAAWWVLAGAALLLAGVTAVAIRTVSGRPYLLIGWCWFLVTLTPVIGIVQAGDQGVADRYGYLPLIGLSLATAWGARDLVRRWARLPRLLPIAAIAIVVAAAIDARGYLWCWHDGVALWSRAVAVDPASDRAHANLADALASDDRIDDALREYREAILLAPAVTEYRRYLGVALARHGRLDEAIAELRAVLAGRPDDAATHAELGVALSRAGQVAAAVTEEATAVRLDPASASAQADYGLALAQAGSLDAAVAACRQALALDPDLAQAHSNLAAIDLARGRTPEAIAEFTEAQRLDPWSVERLVNLGGALVRAGRTDDARQAFERALERDPNAAEAFNGLGVLLSMQGHTQEAIEAFTKALAARPDLAHVYSNRGRAYAMQGDTVAAVQDFEAVLRLDPGNAGARAAIDSLKVALSGGRD